MTRMPLEGYRILDLSVWLAGPGGTALLADMGADVIKIEDPERGDPFRAVAPAPGQKIQSGVEILNRNKRGMTLNLKSEEGLQIFYRMLETADVVAENYRPGVAERLGVDYETLVRHNPRIILASFNGMGSNGPDAGLASYDLIGHARSGLMDLLYHRRPQPAIYRHVLVDISSAIMFGFTILAALAGRAIDGSGQRVEMSQLSTCMMLQYGPIHTFLLNNQLPRLPGRKQPGNPLINAFKGKDGKWLVLSCVQPDRYWSAICEVLGLQHLEKDPRFATMAERDQHAGELVDILDPVFATRSRDEWVSLLKARDVVCSAVQDYRDLVRDPQVIANEYIQEVEHPTAGRIREMAAPIKFSRTKPRFRNTAPEFGQHTEEILLEHGFSWEDIGRFRAQRAI
jgi:crotonobetainyl-CoA:carnitine CoA-transferase CaiB-like acyl-CoA transferase